MRADRRRMEVRFVSLSEDLPAERSTRHWPLAFAASCLLSASLVGILWARPPVTAQVIAAEAAQPTRAEINDDPFATLERCGDDVLCGADARDPF